MKSKSLMYVGILACVAAVGAAFMQNIDTGSKLFISRSTPSQYVLVLNSQNTPTGLTSSYQNNFSGTVKHSSYSSLDISMSFVNAKSLSGGFVELAPHGKIYNFGASDNHVTGVDGIKFTGTGTLLFKPVVTRNSDSALLADMDPVSINAGSSKVTVPTCDYFQIEATDGGATITELSVYYCCDTAAYDVKLLNGTYTGLGADNYDYKLTVNNGTATFQSINKSPAVSYSGTATLASKTAATISVNNSTISYSYDGYGLTFNSQTGSVTMVDFTRVYKIDDFESYTASGQGYTNSTTKYQTSGLRANYYADYYTGSSTGEIGGSGWPVMTSTDNTNYVSTKGHNGSKGVIFKFSNGTGMRYISMNELYGVKSIIGRGSKLSFWARGAYTNTNFNTDHASNTTMKAYAYFASPLTPSNQSSTSARETFDFTVQAGSTWQHFEFNLTEGREYYGFGLYAQQSSGSTQYVPFDDFEIYSVSPYLTYVAVTGVSLNNTSLSLHAGNHSQLIATITPSNASDQAVTWTSSNTSVATVNSEGVVSAVNTGNATITCRTDDGGYTATCSVTVTSATLTYPEGTFRGDGTIGSGSSQYSSHIELAIGNQQNGIVKVLINGIDVNATSISFSSNKITIATSGQIDNKDVKNITGTYNSSTGQITSIKSSNTRLTMSFTATRVATSSTYKFFDFDGSTSELQSQFVRRTRYNDTWHIDTINHDRIVSNANQYVSGTGANTVKGDSVDAAVGFSLATDFSSAFTANNLHFWVYNPSSTAISLTMYLYKATGYGSAITATSKTANANGWTYIVTSFTSSAIYNFNISDWTQSGVNLTFDNMILFNS